MTSPMSPRERILNAINHKPVDRFPTDIWAVPEVWQKLKDYFRTNDTLEIYEHLGIDGIIGLSPEYHGPAFHGPDPSLTYNEWGWGMRKTEYQGGIYEEQVYFPLATAETIEDLERFPWPDPEDYDYSVIAEKAQKFPDRARMCGYSAIFYYHNNLRGLECSLMDPILRPEFTRVLLQKISDIFFEYHRRCFEAAPGLIDITQVTDDFGSQNGLLISPKLFDEFYRPHMQRAIDLAHSFGIQVFHHDDGDCRRLLPRLIEMGINILNPIQWRCGNWDLSELKEKYGARICFHGGVDNQNTLPFGSPEDVAREVRWLKETLGSDQTGLIIAPCHNIQAITPLENILTLYKTVSEE